jgi:hypothetical protein
MRARRLALLLAALLAGAPAAARQVVTSPAPEAVSVTVYGDPRGSEERLNLEWLGGYALITETRTISLPAGDSVIRFEGVAGNILPASAIIRGLPSDVAEKNHDARLLSPGALVDAALGRQVHIRRTDPATGRVSESEAIIRSGPNGIVLQTPTGIEGLRCSGLPETLVYDAVPEGLSAKPTLAVSTSAVGPVTASVQLSYLATQFDWRANYVANLSDDGRTLDLFAWLTLANGNAESFVDAGTQVVAGKPNREDEGGGAQPLAPGIELHCWPTGTTSDLPYTDPTRPPTSIQGTELYENGSIVVTGSRIRMPNLTSSSPVTVVTAQLEGLGDLKLYRIPIPVTVAANAQKQVALLHHEKVKFDRLYGAYIYFGGDPIEREEPRQAYLLLRTKNVEKNGLGRPLPTGQIQFFEPAGGRPMLAGEGWLRDTAVGEDVELGFGESPDIMFTARTVAVGKARGDDEDDRPVTQEVRLSNATRNRADVEVEIAFNEEDYDLSKPSHKLVRKKGRNVWQARVPANGTARLTFTIAPKPPRPDQDD